MDLDEIGHDGEPRLQLHEVVKEKVALMQWLPREATNTGSISSHGCGQGRRRRWWRRQAVVDRGTTARVEEDAAGSGAVESEVGAGYGYQIWSWGRQKNTARLMNDGSGSHSEMTSGDDDDGGGSRRWRSKGGFVDPIEVVLAIYGLHGPINLLKFTSHPEYYYLIS